MFNLACLISFFRIFLAFITVWLLYSAHFQAALFSFMFAALSDVLDGLVARVCNQKTTFGQILDPVADKIFAICVMVTLFFMQEHTFLRYVLSFLLIKEFILLTFGAWLWFKYHRFMMPSKLSRFVSFSEFCLMFMLILSYSFYVVNSFVVFLCVLNVCASIILLISYVQKLRV